MKRPIVPAAALAATGVSAIGAPEAEAHGLVGRADLPIPDWLFTWGAIAVLLVSFVVLAVAWRRPRLQDDAWRPLPDGLSRLLTSRAVEVAGGAVGVALLGLVVYAGLFGTDSTSANIAPTLVYVVFWLGLVPVSLLFGDVFRVLNPWRAIGRATGWLFARASKPVAATGYPERLGYWPAAVGLLAFGWLELVAPNGDRPATLAVATLIYSTLTLTAMALFGTERWCDRGEAFSVYFGLFARLSPWERRDRTLGLRRPLAGLAAWPGGSGSLALLAAMIGVVSFDGLSAGQPFNDAIAAPLAWLRDGLGIAPSPALQAAFGTGLLVMTLAAAAFYRLGIAGTPTAGAGRSRSRLAQEFVHTLVPIALAYVGAHYLSLLLFQGQALGYLASDPLGTGLNLLGTADAAIDYQLVGAEALWYAQVAFVVVGHVVALVLAHDRALAIFGDARAAMRSQYPLLIVMVGYTTLALWLLAQAREG